jgi:S-adenosylmethionine hydrolase
MFREKRYEQVTGGVVIYDKYGTVVERVEPSKANLQNFEQDKDDTKQTKEGQ